MMVIVGKFQFKQGLRYFRLVCSNFNSGTFPPPKKKAKSHNVKENDYYYINYTYEHCEIAKGVLVK